MANRVNRKPVTALQQEKQFETPAFDYVAALDRTDAWVIETIGQAFLDESDTLSAEMRGAIESGDHVLLMRSAHTLRGLVGNFNARGVEDIARRIENLVGQRDMTEAMQLAIDLQGEMARLKLALVEYLAALTKN